MEFYKYCASGNDFVVINASEKKGRSALAKGLCSRYESIDADGFIVVLSHEKYDFEWEFYNNDGSTASVRGSGPRAAVHFIHHISGIKPHMVFLTGVGVIKANVDNSSIEVSLGKIRNIQDTLSEYEKNWQLYDTGVPHLVHFCENLDEFDLKLCKRMREEYNANVNFVKVESDNTLRVCTFERGVEDETQACGTGMGACFYLVLLNKKTHNQARAIPKSGEEPSFKFENEELFFKGKVRCYFEANYNFS